MVEWNHFLKYINTWIFNSKTLLINYSIILIVMFAVYGVGQRKNLMYYTSHVLYLPTSPGKHCHRTIYNFPPSSPWLVIYPSIHSFHLFKALSHHDLLILPGIISILVLQAWFLWCHLTHSFIHSFISFSFNNLCWVNTSTRSIHCVKSLFLNLQSCKK